jgi:DNA polymerase elongation subunit (family B)
MCSAKVTLLSKDLSIDKSINSSLDLSVIKCSNSNIFWDIETSTDLQFSNADRLEDVIYMISIVTDLKQIILIHLHTLNIKKIIYSSDFEYVDIECDSEYSLLLYFYKIVSKLEPQHMIQYNGNYFDLPYVFKRTRRLSMFSNEINLDARIVHIDLIIFFRRYFSNFNSFKLDDVSKFFIGKGKTGLSIKTAMEYIKSGEPDKISVVANYSIQDSVLLHDIYIHNNIEIILKNQGSRLIDSKEFDSKESDSTGIMLEPTNKLLSLLYSRLSMSSSEIVERYYHTLPKTVYTRGIYQNVYEYDYSPLYINLMKSHRINPTTQIDNKTSLLSTTISGFYSEIVSKIYYLYTKNVEVLEEYLKVYDLIYRDNTKMLSSTPIELIKLTNQYKLYANITSTCFIAIDQNDELIIKGRYHRLITHTPIYLKLLKMKLINNNKKINIVDLCKDLNLEEIIGEIRLYHNNSYSIDSLEGILLKQWRSRHGHLNTFTTVKFLFTNKGIQLYPIIADVAPNLNHYISSLTAYDLATTSLLAIKKS